jgi:hypothetical protein
MEVKRKMEYNNTLTDSIVGCEIIYLFMKWILAYNIIQIQDFQLAFLNI